MNRVVKATVEEEARWKEEGRRERERERDKETERQQTDRERGGGRKERREYTVVSMAPKRRGVYVVSADVSFLLANKASL